MVNFWHFSFTVIEWRIGVSANFGILKLLELKRSVFPSSECKDIVGYVGKTITKHEQVA